MPARLVIRWSDLRMMPASFCSRRKDSIGWSIRVARKVWRGQIAMTLLDSDYIVDLELSAAEAEGRGEIISSPRLITANQREATIKQGVEIPYQESSSSGATTTSFKDAVLSLKVTPQITEAGRLLEDDYSALDAVVVGRAPSCNWIQFHAKTGGFNVTLWVVPILAALSLLFVVSLSMPDPDEETGKLVIMEGFTEQSAVGRAEPERGNHGTAAFMVRVDQEFSRLTDFDPLHYTREPGLIGEALAAINQWAVLIEEAAALDLTPDQRRRVLDFRREVSIVIDDRASVGALSAFYHELTARAGGAGRS